MSRVFAGLLISAAVLAGMYGAASTLATNLAATYRTAAATGGAQANYTAAADNASAEYKGARARCGSFKGHEKHVCVAEAICNAKSGPGKNLCVSEATAEQTNR